MRTHGFTLVELLIVLTLMGLAASLVGPATVEQVEKAQARAELNRLKSTVRKVSNIAFTRSGNVSLYFYNNELIYRDGSELSDTQPEVHTFKFIGFPAEQMVAFNHNGYPDPESLSIVFKGARQEINLFRLVEVTD